MSKGGDLSNSLITSFRLPLTTWRALKFQATRERCDMREIVLRSLERELGEKARPGVDLVETTTK
jgi:hypothetical protein